MDMHAKVKRFWTVMAGVVPALVLALSMGLADQAQAISTYDAAAFGSVKFLEIDGVIFDDFDDSTNIFGEAIPGVFPGQEITVGASAGAGEFFLNASARAGGRTEIPGWVISGANAAASMTIFNDNNFGVEVDFLLQSTVEGEIDTDNSLPGLEEMASADAFVAFLVDGENLFKRDVFINAFNGESDAAGTTGPFEDSFFIDAGQTVTVALRTTAEGKAHITPEPASVLLMGSGLIGLGAWQWRRRQRERTAA